MSICRLLVYCVPCTLTEAEGAIHVYDSNAMYLVNSYNSFVLMHNMSPISKISKI